MDERLPVKQIFFKEIRLPFEKHRDLIRLGWPCAVMFLISSFFNPKFDWWLLDIVFGIAVSLLFVLATVGCHKVFLQPSDTVAQLPTFRWRSYDSEFLLTLISMFGLLLFISIPIFIASFYLYKFEIFAGAVNREILDILIYLPISYVVARWSLLLPDSALDNENTFSWAWKLSSGHSFRLFVLIGLIPLLTSLVFEYANFLLEFSYVFIFIQNLIWLFVCVVEVCLLSLCYEWLNYN